MLITPVDNEKNLFYVKDVFTKDLVNKVLSTPWLDLDWVRQEGQEDWKRRRIKDSVIPWVEQWHQELNNNWHVISEQIGRSVEGYLGTAFWVDEPGFTCSMHTDGELPGSLHMTWIGAGTIFYWYKNSNAVRYQVPSYPNSGYIMINMPDDTGYRKLLWHDMPHEVPTNSFRLTTYSWIRPL